MFWKVSTLEKKNVVQTSTFNYEDDTGKVWSFELEEGWRWGDAVIETDDEPKAEEDPYADGFVVSDYSCDDMNMDDGCWGWFTFPEDMPQELRDKIESLWDEGSYSAFEENGIEQWECETVFYGPLEVECVDTTPMEKVEPDPSKSTWPF